MNLTKYNEVELSFLKCTELRELCKENKVKIKGKGRKHELIETLKSIPAFFHDDDDDDSLLVENMGHTAHRPVFGDISNITPDSPIASSVSTLKNFSTDIKVKEDNIDEIIRRFEEPAKFIADLMERKKIELEKSRCRGENHLQKLLEQRVLEREEYLTNKYEEELKAIKAERELMENKLEEDFVRQLQQKEDIIHMKENERKGMKTEMESQLRKREELILDNERLTNRVKLLNNENTELNKSVNELKKNIEGKENELTKQTELIKTIETNVKHNIIENIEDEVTCIICQELFIRAATLPCGHSFCEMCLRTWFKTKKTCPVCRHDVKHKVALYSVVLDSVVENIVENSDAENKRKRTNLLRERNEQKRISDNSADPQGILKMFYNVNDNIGPQLPAASNQPVPNDRRRSRSQSPARAIPNRQFANNNSNNRNNNISVQGNRLQYQNVSTNRNNYSFGNNNNNFQNRMYGVRCYHCGANNHVIRDCPRRR